MKPDIYSLGGTASPESQALGAGGRAEAPRFQRSFVTNEIHHPLTTMCLNISRVERTFAYNWTWDQIVSPLVTAARHVPGSKRTSLDMDEVWRSNSLVAQGNVSISLHRGQSASRRGAHLR